MKIRRLAFRFFLLTLFAIANRPVHAQTRPPEGVQQFAAFGDFRLQSGSVIHDFKLGYRTLGTLNSDRSNAILWPTWLGGTTSDLLQFIGPANVVDSNKYFVVLVDAIGNGVSSSPSNSKSQPLLKFPEFQIRDMVEAEHRLATDVLHLSHLRAVIGISMGGMQTFCWVLTYRDFMDVAIPMMGSPQSTSYDKLLWTAQIDAIESDPAWNHGHPVKPMTSGIALSEEIDSMNSTSPAYRVAHTDPKAFDAFLYDRRKNSKASGGSAYDQIRQRQAIIAIDLPGSLGLTLAETAKRVRAKLLIIISSQDHMVNPTPASEFAAAAGAPLLTLNSTCGHESLSCISVGPIVASFLADPSSVHSTTLQDPAE
jgi:homoserine O-acetyltransferase/O-succinyltransferase